MEQWANSPSGSWNEHMSLAWSSSNEKLDNKKLDTWIAKLALFSETWKEYDLNSPEVIEYAKKIAKGAIKLSLSNK